MKLLSIVFRRKRVIQMAGKYSFMFNLNHKLPFIVDDHHVLMSTFVWVLELCLERWRGHKGEKKTKALPLRLPLEETMN